MLLLGSRPDYMPSKSSNDCKRVLLVDDHPLTRQVLKQTLARENLAVCGEAEDRAGTLAAIEARRPDLAIMELRLKNSDGMELLQDLHDRHPKMLTLVLSSHDESLYAERAIRAGASGYISKQEPLAKILEAVRKVLAGETYLSEKMAARVATRQPVRFAAPTAPRWTCCRNASRRSSSQSAAGLEPPQLRLC